MVQAPVYGVIFDLMGTLATYGGTRAELHTAWERGATALYRYLAAQGLSVPPEAFAAALQTATAAELAHRGSPREISVAAALATALRQFDFPLMPEQFIAAERAYFGPELDEWHVLPGAVEAVETLNEEGLRLAVVSNAPSHVFVEEAIARIGLRPYLSPVMSSAKAGARKPDPRLFQAIMADWQLRPQNVVMVGDGLAADIAGAYAAGMRGVLVYSAANPDNAGYSGDAVPDADIADIAALPALIARWQAAVEHDARPETGFIEDF